MPSRTIAREGSIAAAFLVLTAIATYPLIVRFGSAIPPGEDSWLYYWNLWWVKRALADLHVNPLFTPDVHFPYGSSLYFHTLNLLPSIIGVPVAITAGLPAGYNFLVFVAFTLTGYGTYRLALYQLSREMIQPGITTHESRARLAAFVAAVAFTFSSYHLAHLHGHLDLISTAWLPLFVLFLLRTRDDRRWTHPILCGVFLAAAALTAVTYLAFLLVFTAALIGHTLLSRGRAAWPPVARIAVALSICALLTSPVLVPMLILGRTMGRSFNPGRDVVTFSTDALAFLIPSPLHPLWGGEITAAYQSLFGRSAGFDHVAFLGYVPMMLAVVAVRRYRPWLMFWLLAFSLFALLALGPVAHIGGHSTARLSIPMPYRLFSLLPYGDIPRVPARFVVLALLCLSLLAGYGAWVLLESRRLSTGYLITTLLVGLMLFENAAIPLLPSAVDVPPFFDRLGRQPVRSGVLEVPITDDPAAFPRRMLFQTRHAQPIYQGYLARGVSPLRFDLVPGFRQFKALSPNIDDVVTYDSHDVAAISRRALLALGAGHVVVEKRYLNDPALVARARAIGNELFGPAAAVYDDELTLAYAIPLERQASRSVLWLDTGWSYLEHLDQADAARKTVRWRWMGDRARVALLADASTSVRLKLSAQAFDRLRHLRLSLGSVEIAMLPVTTSRTDYETAPFRIPGGLAFVDFSSVEGADPAGADPRRLSVALFHIDLMENDQARR